MQLYHIIVLTLSIAVECVNVLDIRTRESISLTEATKRDAAINRFNGWLSVAGEREGTVVHDGAYVVRHSLGGHKGRARCFKITLNSCN